MKVFWNRINYRKESNVYFCNNYSEKLSEFHIHDDLYINRAYYYSRTHRTTTLTNDHPSYTTIFRVTDSVFCLYDPWPTTIPLTRPATGSDGIFSLADDHIAYSRTTVEWMSDVGQHVLHIISIGGSTKTNTKILRIACKSGWWRVPLIVFAVNDRTSITERKHIKHQLQKSV